MLVGAILVIGQSSPVNHWTQNSCGDLAAPGMLGNTPIACLELLGRTILDRVVQKLHQDGVGLITVVAGDEFSHLARTSATSMARIRSVSPSIDVWSAAECVLHEYVEQGVESVLLTSIRAYAELDFPDLIRFHREMKQGLTSVTNPSGPVDLRIVDARRVVTTRAAGLSGLMDHGTDAEVALYPVRGYFNPLNDARDIRQLVVDAFLSRCEIRPQGTEITPGIWLDDGARVHRRARIEAPAYLGSGTRLRADTLVTRFSALERGCDIHEGTVIGDSSILAHTGVGKGLSLTHSVADGNKLFLLRGHLAVEIQDSKLLHRTLPIQPLGSMAGGGSSTSLAERLLAATWT
jgi:NDP-sugar pyrophosphorylase family protein